MDVRVNTAPSAPSFGRIRPASLDPDTGAGGSAGSGWSLDTGNPGQNRQPGKGFGAIVDGSADIRQAGSDAYLTAMYVQYVDYRGPGRGTVENPLAPRGVRAAQTVPMSLAVGLQVDYTV
ncbi:hypothetical protein LWF15_25175 [Kineosporia rhizophila]|uniref:hypothetical protein n=1 Tax=Kineosporia TaxID=49184 RepID=UPI001E5DB1E5|nr:MULTISPECIES: hypothetical protein [Kineosporia]MCE0538797.1 hypothetical protein [Kineosporia rhizophila]GLY18714.1 hypothetical protein Kisp01_57280 [Kineosporia sp. NBRC 101677]